MKRELLEQALEDVKTEGGEATGQFRVDFDVLVDIEKAKRDAAKLFEAGEGRLGTDEETFLRIFATNEVYQMRRTYDEYVKVSCVVIWCFYLKRIGRGGGYFFVILLFPDYTQYRSYNTYVYTHLELNSKFVLVNLCAVDTNYFTRPILYLQKVVIEYEQISGKAHFGGNTLYIFLTIPTC
jgi:hypothetical protein